jgi:hypothetical protein
LPRNANETEVPKKSVLRPESLAATTSDCENSSRMLSEHGVGNAERRGEARTQVRIRFRTFESTLKLKYA